MTSINIPPVPSNFNSSKFLIPTLSLESTSTVSMKELKNLVCHKTVIKS
jgi:hypothetical protein